VVVCPGGGYGTLALDHEGKDVAKWLASKGIVSLVLEYRMNRDGYQHPIPLQDAQRAVRYVRANADELGVDSRKIGLLGFSAGGHLAASAGTHFDEGQPESADSVERQSSRPDFLVLCYPVITMREPFTHMGSRQNLLGMEASSNLVSRLSCETQVTTNTPPTFLWHTDEDPWVPAENSVMFYQALRRAGVPAELHIYRRGNHGVGLATYMPDTGEWKTACLEWMKGQGILE